MSVDIPSTGSESVSECETLSLANSPALYFHQFSCVLGPIPAVSCNALPVSPWIDGLPRLISNLTGSCQGPWWLSDCRIEYRCSYLVVLFHILHYSSLNGIYFSVEHRGVEPKIEAVPPPRASTLHPSTGTLLVLDLCIRPGPICLGWTRSTIHNCQET
jgi:hypothetical protein